MSEFFEPDDFLGIDMKSDLPLRCQLANIANAKLEQKGQVFYGSWIRGGVFDGTELYDKLKWCGRALVVNIEPGSNPEGTRTDE